MTWQVRACDFRGDMLTLIKKLHRTLTTQLFPACVACCEAVLTTGVSQMAP